MIPKSGMNEVDVECDGSLIIALGPKFENYLKRNIKILKIFNI